MRQRSAFALLIGVTIAMIVCQPPLAHAGSAPTWTKEEFQRRFPPPDWWNEVKAPEIKNHNQLSAYWLRKDRSPKQFFKATYQALQSHPSDADLVVNAINLMPYDYEEYPHMLDLQEYALEHYFSYKQVHRPGGTGDVIAGIVENAARRYIQESRYDKVISLVERLFSERKNEINDHMLEQITIDYAFALRESGQIDRAKDVLKHAIKAYKGGWEHALQNQLEFYEANGHIQIPSLFITGKGKKFHEKIVKEEIEERGGETILKLGMSREEVTALLGGPGDTREVATEDVDEEMHYGAVILSFKNGRLVKAHPPEIVQDGP